MEFKVNLKIFAFIAIFYLTGQLEIYGILMFFAFLHELGHLLAGMLMKFRPKSLRIMPVGLAISFAIFPKDYNSKVKNANLLTIKKLIIALAGPITNGIIVLVLSFLPTDLFLGIDKTICIYANILIALFNLLPIYPLDGGRILKCILTIFSGSRKSMVYTNKVSNAIVILLTMASSILIYSYQNIAILIIVIYLWILVLMQNKRYTTKMKMYELLDQSCKQEIRKKNNENLLYHNS